MTQIAVRVDDELLGFVDRVRGDSSRSGFVKGLVESAFAGWLGSLPGDDGPVTLEDGPQAEYVDFGDIEPVSLDGPDYDEAESLPSFVEPQPWQIDAERVSARYRRDLERLAEVEPANPYLLP